MAYKPKVLSPADGGTGVANNAASTLTISGAFGATFTLTNTTSVTFPTSGTLATTAAIPSFPLSVANGGTGVGTLTNHGVLLGQATSNVTATAAGSAGQVLQSGGASADPTYSTATYPSTASSSGTFLRANGTNWLTSSSTIPDTFAQGDIVYGSATNTLTALAKDTNSTRVLTNTGTNNNPAWAQVTLTSGVTGTLPVGNGGTGVANPTIHSIQVGAGSSALTQLAVGSTGQVLQANTSADPSWSTPTYPSASGTAGKVLISDGTNNVYSTPTFPNASATSGKFIRSDGTNWIASTPTLPTSAGTSGKVLQSNGTNYVETTATYPATTIANQFLYSSADNTVAGLSNGTNGQVIIAATSAAPAYATLGSTGGSLAYTTGTNSLSIDLASFVQSVNYTPALSFGGASVGITYTTQLGRYTRLCNVVFFEATIVLSSKGSSTGNAAISIPVNTINASVGKFICAMEATATMPASCTFFIGECGTANSGAVSLVGCGASTITNLTDANFGAATTVRVTGWYLAA